MQRKFIIALITAGLFLSGCATSAELKGGKKKPQIYRSDLDNDLLQEIIEVQDNGAEGALIRLKRPDKFKSEIAQIKVPGPLTKTEIIDLKSDGYKQIAVYYDDPGSNTANLVIYNLKNSKLSKVATFSARCGIEGFFGTAIGRVKIGRPKGKEESCQSESMTEYDFWVWSGDKFIKER
jgi:hypothetical protein